MEDRMIAFLKKGVSDKVTPEDAEVLRVSQNRLNVSAHYKRVGGGESAQDIILRGAKKINQRRGIPPGPDDED